MKISGKILVISAMLLMLLLSLILYFIYKNVDQSYEQSFDKMNLQLEKKQHLSTMYTAARERSIILFNMYRETDTFRLDEYRQELREYASAFIKARLKLHSLNLNAYEIERLKEQNKLVKINSVLQNNVADLILANEDKNQIEDLLYSALDSQNNNIDQINKLIHYFEQESLTSFSGLQDEKKRIDQQFILFTILLLFGGSLFISFLIFYILKREKRHFKLQLNEKQKTADKLSYQASHDALTGLVNRFSLEERLEQSISLARRNNEEIALMLFDMDRFKVINDTMGHQAGDAMLIIVAKRLRLAILRESDIVARLGGDEFVVVLTGLEKDAEMVAGLVAKTLVHILGQPYMIDKNEFHSTPSIGISIFPNDGDHSDILIKHADTAMYHVKENGRNDYHFFTEALNLRIKEQVAIENELRIALSNNQFVLHYQPQINPADNTIFAFEALLRWRHPERGLVFPDTFIPIAEDSGLIYQLGNWVIDEACRQQVSWREQGVADIQIAVNLSAYELCSIDLVREVKSIIDKHGVEKGKLEIEVTESAAMNDPEQAIDQLVQLRELGIKLAIDDFGTGYSSLSYLKQLPIHTLKLDRTFVREIGISKNDAEISSATLALAHNLGLKVVAEGVETEEQRDFLISKQCDLLQGFFYSKPLPAIEAAAYIKNFDKG